MANKTIKPRVISSCERLLQEQHYISLIDLFKAIGLIHPVHEQYWKRGKSKDLETFIKGGPEKISDAITCYQDWAYAVAELLYI